MAFLRRIQKLDCSGGVQTRTVEPLALPSQVKNALNADFSTKLGAITGRRGSLVQSVVVAAQTVLNIFQWIKNDGTTKYLSAISDGVPTTGKVDVFVNSAVLAGTWAKSREDLADAVTPYAENFINKLIVANGVDAVQGWDGTTWSAITNAPVAGKFPAVYQQKLFLLTENGFLHYSDVINATGTDFTTTLWNNRGINPNDGQKSKMVKRHRNRLVIFKEESIYRYDGANEPEAVIMVGTHSSKSVVINGDIYFHHPTGYYRMGIGEPVCISRSVQKYFDGMSNANWTKVASGRDLENVYCWIGDVTINDPLEHDYGVTYSNVVLVYNIFAQTWTVYTGWDARVWHYDETSGLSYFGTSTGKIVQINKDYADVDGATSLPITFEVIFMPEDCNYPEKYKEFGLIKVIGKFTSDVLIAEDFDGLEGKLEFGSKRSGINPTCQTLWVAVREQYETKPPRVEALIIDNVNLLDDAN
jgi:hypothetical protein